MHHPRQFARFRNSRQKVIFSNFCQQIAKQIYLDLIWWLQITLQHAYEWLGFLRTDHVIQFVYNLANVRIYGHHGVLNLALIVWMVNS
jgi:hypothetical protein